MADTAAALVIQLSADFKQFQKEMRAATGAFDAEGRKIEARQKKLRATIEATFSGMGKYIVGGAALYGIKEFVSRVVEAGGKIKDTADAIGIGTNEIQAWGALAGEAGVDQETFNSALDKFSKSLGEAAIKGGPALQMFKALGVNVKGDTTAAFYQFADAVAKTKEGQQRTALVTEVFGKKMANLVPVISQGSAALKKQTAEIVASGGIFLPKAIDKLDDFEDAWGRLTRKLNAVAGNAFADPLTHITDALKDPQVQSALRVFAKLLGEVAEATAQAAKYAPALAAAYAGFKIGRFAGMPGAIAGAAIGAVGGTAVQGPDEASLRARLAHAKQLAAADPVRAKDLAHSIASMTAQVAAIDAQRVTAPGAPGGGKHGGGGIDRGDLLNTEATKRLEGKKALQDIEIAGIKAVRDANLQAGQEIRQDSLDTAQARRDDIKAQDDALLQLAQGTAGYYALERQIIIEVANLDIQSINDRKDAELTAITERATAQDQAFADERRALKTHLDELVLSEKITRKEAIDSLNKHDAAVSAERAARDEANASHRVALEQESASQITAINAKKNADLKQSDEEEFQLKARAIELNNAFRDGIESIGVAALHGFGSMKDAAASFLETLADMIIKLYVIKPLLDSLDRSSPSGGGGFFASLFGFADGGVMTPSGPRALRRFAGGGTSNTAAIFGEAGPEAAVPLPDGRSIPVSLRIPNISSRSTGAPTIIQQFDLSGAVVTDEIMAEARRAGSSQAQVVVAQYDRSALPHRVRTLTGDPRRNY